MNKLKAKRVLHGYSQEDIAKRLNLSTGAYNLRENGKREFRKSEIKTIKNILNLTPYEIDDIFFSEVANEKEATA